MGVIENLARRFPQLYLTPAKGVSETPVYRNITRKGEEYQGTLSDHFTGTERDFTESVRTPAGDAEIIFLANRSDFECFYRIMGCKCENTDVPATCGAGTISGINDWSKIKEHKKEYESLGGTDWNAEFKLFTKDKKNYTTSLIILSEGPYSALPAGTAGFSAGEWLRISLGIRRYHELTHFVCRKMFPELRDIVFDEVLADAIGITETMGIYDERLAGLFLFDLPGHEGRLKNYVPAEAYPKTEEKAKKLVRYFGQESGNMKEGLFERMIDWELRGKKYIDGETDS